MKMANIWPKSLRFLQIWPNQGHFWQDLGQIRRNLADILTKMVQISSDLPTIVGNLVGWLDWFDQILEKEKRHPTHQTRVLEEQTWCQPSKKSDRSAAGRVQSAIAGGLGIQIALTVNTLTSKKKKKPRQLSIKKKTLFCFFFFFCHYWQMIAS